MSVQNVQFMKPELSRKLDIYNLIKNCIGGQGDIKEQREKYLPAPNAYDKSIENKARYNAYLERALFYNATSGTLNGLVSQIFMRDPEIILPTLLEPLREDANGAGVSLVQLAKRAAGNTIAYGRNGIFVDFPIVETSSTVNQVKLGFVRPTISIYEPWQIINWRTRTVGAKQMLSVVVIKEFVDSESDDFETEKVTQYRVLRLGASKDNPIPKIKKDESTYTIEIWSNKGQKDPSEFGVLESYQPKDADGNFMSEIPFMFIGSTNNDNFIDNPPLGDLAVLNIAHYRNSADYEESCFITGQPTPWFSGLTETWVKDVLKGKVELGCRAAVPLPEKGLAGLLQAEPNTMPREAMLDKQKMMVAIGAKLIEQSNIEKTATEVSFDKSSEMSILESTTKNVNEGFSKALKWCASFISIGEEGLSFKMNDDFKISSLSPEDRRMQLEEWQGGLLSWTEARENLRRSNISSLSNEDAKSEIDKEQELRMSRIESLKIGKDRENEEKV